MISFARGQSCIVCHRFSFLHEPSGLITEVRYPPDEDAKVVNLKKGLLGSLVGTHEIPVGEM